MSVSYRKESIPTPIALHRNHSKWIKDLSVRLKTPKLLEEVAYNTSGMVWGRKGLPE